MKERTGKVVGKPIIIGGCRWSHVLKYIALGASKVGIGHGFLYAFYSYGQGVGKFIEILRDELEMNVRGARSLISEIVL